MLENDEGDEDVNATTPSLSASNAGTELNSSHTFAGKSSDNPVGQQQPVIHFIDGVNQGWTKLNTMITRHLVRLKDQLLLRTLFINHPTQYSGDKIAVNTCWGLHT